MKTMIPIIIQPATENYYWVKNVLEGIVEGASRYDCELMMIDKACICEKNISSNTPVLVNGYLSHWLSATANVLRMNGYTPIIVNASHVNQKYYKYSNVCFDIDSGFRSIIELCLSSGRKNIVLFGVRKSSAGDMEKFKTFQQCVEEYGIVNSKAIFIEKMLEESIEEFMDLFFENVIDAVVCANDTVAVLLIQEFQKNKIRIPEDVLVTGVGDSMVGRLMGMHLISLTADYVEMGKQAVRLWRYLYKDGTNINITVSIACKLNKESRTVGYINEPHCCARIPMESNAADSGWNDYFYEDEKVKRMHKLEVLLRNCDTLDLQILEAIEKCTKDEDIASKVWITPRAIRYRVNKMMKKIGVQHRNEIAALLQEFNIWEKSLSDSI